MRLSNSLRSAAVLAATLIVGLRAVAATLTIGDTAPPLDVAKWVQGEPVQSFDSNHVYVVEFWATWCGPCRASIPHLNELWEKYKDKGVIVIGEDVWEPDDSGVPAFVKKMGNQMTYRVAVDDKSQDKDGAMATTWMKAAGQNGIPTAFVINRQGKIAWIGHPLTLETSVLDEILADKFDVAAFRADFEKEQQDQQARQALLQNLSRFMKDKNWDGADKAVDAIEKTLPANAHAQLSAIRVRILIGRGDIQGACRLAEATSDANLGEAVLQNQLAWTLATAHGLDEKEIALAEKIAERANNGVNGKNSGILDTLARLQFMAGHTNDAIASEQKAVDMASDETKAALQKTLAEYQAGKLPDVKNDE